MVKLVTLQQAAAETGVPYTSVRDLVLRGFLPRVQLGDSRRIWVRREDLDRLIAGDGGSLSTGADLQVRRDGDNQAA